VASRSISGVPDFAASYEAKTRSYFDRARVDFVHRLPLDPTASVLEIGCGTGATGALALKRGRAGRYVGVELFEGAATSAREVLSEVVVGDVEQMEFDWQPASICVSRGFWLRNCRASCVRADWFWRVRPTCRTGA
jgi:ubiquinone/menaquinone biosynthesis C-methylase UbiE